MSPFRLRMYWLVSFLNETPLGPMSINKSPGYTDKYQEIDFLLRVTKEWR